MAFYSQTNRQVERVNQELKQYLRMFINHRQEQWSDWLGIAEFVYNNKAYSSTKISSFKTNYRQDSRMEFEVRRKGKEVQLGITQGIHSKTTIWLGEKKIRKREEKEIGRKLVLMEKFLGTRKLEGGAML